MVEASKYEELRRHVQGEATVVLSGAISITGPWIWNMIDFRLLSKVYISSMSKVYERQVSDFFERGKMSLGLGQASSASTTASSRLAPATLTR